MILQWLRIIAILHTATFSICFGINCFHCVSPDKHHNATTRRQLATQTDVFFYPIGVKSTTCSDYIELEDTPIVEGQICSENSTCVTLVPNLENTTFVVRGCLERVIRHNYREQLKLFEPGCFLVRSIPTFSNTSPMDYVICTCDEPYCNNMPIPPFIPEPLEFPKSRILHLTSDPETGNSLQIMSSRRCFSGFFSAALLIVLFVII